MRRVLSYPVLLTMAMILDRIVVSILQIDSVQSLRPFFVIMALIIFTALIIHQRIRDWHRTDFLVLLVLLLYLLYRYLYGLFKQNFPQQADYLALALIPLFGYLYLKVSRYRFWRSFHNPKQVSYYFNLVFAILLTFQFARLSEVVRNIVLSQSHPQDTAIAPLHQEIHLGDENRPDIYLIVLDGYGRQDVLQQMYGYDNSEFLQKLEERGFYVADDSHSNYVQTPHSISSLLNFDYLQMWNPTTDYARYLINPIENNRVFKLLDEIGYTTASFETGPTYTQVENSDVYLSSFLPLNQFETLLLADSPIEPLSDAYDLRIAIPSYKTHRERALYTFDQLKEVPASIPGPRIVYAHILLPHPPFVFDRNGNSLESRRPYSLWDGDEFEGSSDEYRNGYREQLMFVNTRIMDTVDGILERSKTPPIIILMSDHGPASKFKWDFDSPGCVWERTSNLYAVLLPGHQNDGTLYPSISPVNTFRVIFNTYFGTDLPLLEDQSYLMASQYRNKWKDVTEIRNLLNGCKQTD